MTITLNGTTGITTPDVTSDGLTVDSTTLVVDEVNNKVGVGTGSPSYALHLVQPSSDNALVIDNGGGAGDNATPYLAFSGTNTGSNYIRGRIRAALPDATGGGLIFDTGSSGSMTERMRIDTAGRVTMPYQPCFTATNFANAYGSGVLVLPDTLTNVGGHYSTSTGRFTAPVNGKYHISFMAIPGSSTNVSMIIRKNGVDQFPFGYMASDNNDTGAIVAIHSLLAGDYVEIWASGNVETGYVSFTGFLLG